MLDCHFHTNRSYCADRDMTLDVAVDAIAANDSLDAIAITDHTFALYFPEKVAWSWTYMSDSSVFDAHREFGAGHMESYLASIDAKRDEGLLAGLETELMSDGRFTFDPEFRDRIDVLIGSVHFLPFSDNADKSEIFEVWRKNTSALINGGIDILGHPFRFIANHIPVTESVVKDVVEEAIAAGVALELNSHYEVDTDVMMLREVAERNGCLALSTDSHRRDEAGVFSYHEKVLREAGMTLSDFDVFVSAGSPKALREGEGKRKE